jgi:two-component system, NtrC family, response regulator GlrR
MKSTEPIHSTRPLMRVDPKTGELRKRTYRLKVISGPDAGRELPLEESVLIGSHSDAGVVLTDPTISKYHVRLTARSEGLEISDLQSTNGTSLAGVRIQHVLLDFDSQIVLRIGRTEVRIEVAEELLDVSDNVQRVGDAIGTSAAMRKLLGLVERVAASDAPVLLSGETGSGKDIIARTIHQASERRLAPFEVVDCGAIQVDLIEAELFGVKRGAFTGATEDRKGAFMRADGGTLFLDEIGEMPVAVQSTLLRAVETRSIRCLGDNLETGVNVRLIAATHRDLEAEVKKGRFREDLWFRLAVVLLQVPPLRERREDIPALVRKFVRDFGGSEESISPEVLRQLESYAWPGNVRELKNVVHRVIAIGDTGLAQSTEASGDFKSAKEQIIENFTRAYFTTLAERCDGNITQMAREAGLARTHLHRVVKKYRLKVNVDD